MFKYSYSYKYFNLKNNVINIVIQLSFDNMLGKGIYAAKTNVLFRDENGDWGHACGVGDTEESALSMCINEIHTYLKSNNKKLDNWTEINLPSKITFLNKEQTITLYLLNEDNKQIILTNDVKIFINPGIDVIKYISKNKKSFLNNGIKSVSADFLKKNDIKAIFDNMSIKFEL
ncbi:MAG: hypothetical protein PHO33_04130 [Clostridia bacterium]|nr:hypothetical protein [Clostridia bacterium]